MTWDRAGGYGSHAETGVLAPAPTWYLAEGATHSGFNLFYLIQNPSTTAARRARSRICGRRRAADREDVSR